MQSIERQDWFSWVGTGPAACMWTAAGSAGARTTWPGSRRPDRNGRAYERDISDVRDLQLATLRLSVMEGYRIICAGTGQAVGHARYHNTVYQARPQAGAECSLSYINTCRTTFHYETGFIFFGFRRYWCVFWFKIKSDYHYLFQDEHNWLLLALMGLSPFAPLISGPAAYSSVYIRFVTIAASVGRSCPRNNCYKRYYYCFILCHWYDDNVIV